LVTGVAAAPLALGVAPPAAADGAALAPAALAGALGRADGADVAVEVPPQAARSKVAAPAAAPVSNCRRVSTIVVLPTSRRRPTIVTDRTSLVSLISV
jgi:hypothetical protein